MCLYTKYIENPRYKPSKKNNWNPPKCTDLRLKYVPVKCGRCIECRQQEQRQWIVRLSEEIRNNKGLFVTLTINNDNMRNLREKEMNENDICTKAMRLFLERIRKETSKSIRHWAITELGEQKGRIHLHGIFFCNEDIIRRKWQYGHVFIGQFVNEKTIFYITKYMLKQNPYDPNFKGKILCSKGIGAGYTSRWDASRNKYKGENTDESYKLRNGRKIALPNYYRLKIYNEQEREKLWIIKQERGYRYIMGEKIDINDVTEYKKALEYYQRKGIECFNVS